MKLSKGGALTNHDDTNIDRTRLGCMKVTGITKAKVKLFDILVKSGEFDSNEMIQLAILFGGSPKEELKIGSKKVKRVFHSDGISQETLG